MKAVVVRELFWPGVAFAAVTVVALGLRALLLSVVARWGAPRPGRSAFGDAIRLPSILWCLVLGLFVAIETAERLPRRLADDLDLLLQAAVILSVTVTLAGLVGSLIGRAGDRLGGAVTGLAQTTARLGVLVVGLLVMLSALGVHITPILTALGVGGLAVALALRDTLANLFAGMHLLADRPIRVGDYVKLVEGVEGFVVDVGWRSTRLRTLGNNIVILPNEKVAQSVITNYDLPDSRMLQSIRVSVSYAEDPDRVEPLVLEEALKASAELPGLLAEPRPFVRLIPGFGEWSLDFTLFFYVATFVDQALVQDELRRRVLRRFRREGIAMPLPTRLVRLEGSPPA